MSSEIKFHRTTKAFMLKRLKINERALFRARVNGWKDLEDEAIDSIENVKRQLKKYYDWEPTYPGVKQVRSNLKCNLERHKHSTEPKYVWFCDEARKLLALSDSELEEIIKLRTMSVDEIKEAQYV